MLCRALRHKLVWDLWQVNTAILTGFLGSHYVTRSKEPRTFYDLKLCFQDFFVTRKRLYLEKNSNITNKQKQIQMSTVHCLVKSLDNQG